MGGTIEGELCNVEFNVGGKVFVREAVGVPGNLIRWTPCLRVPMQPREEMLYLMDLTETGGQMSQQLYQPLRMDKGELISGYLVSQGEVVAQTPIIDTPVIASVVEKENDSMENEVAGLMGIGLDEGEKSIVECAEESGDHGLMDEELRPWLRKKVNLWEVARCRHRTY